ncbi:MAG: AAA family ATPase [Oligoflexia bacterium]|nr:AAA family ATPase [Oligoflexia bacterium]
MAHLRSRLLKHIITSEMKWSPAVGIYGLRQVGKTTLVEQLAIQENGIIETFDRESTLQSSKEAPIDFCSRNKLLCIDEAQRGPWIFPAIKELIGTKRKPGRFLLTGSIRFTLKKEIRESLTGRVLLHELLPFNISEALALKPSTFLDKALELASSTPNPKKDRHLIEALSHPRGITDSQINRHLETGGLPIPCFSRDQVKRNAWFKGYFETLVTRDIALVDESLSKMSLRQGLSFLRALALHQGREFAINDLPLRPVLAKKMLDTLEALALIETIPPENIRTKAVRKSRLEWKDVGLWAHILGLSGIGLSESEQALKLHLSQEFRSQIGLSKYPTHWSFYKNRDGAEIPWIFRRGQAVVAISFVPVECPEPYDYRVMRRFIENEPHGLGIILGAKRTKISSLGPRLFLLPYHAVY